MKMNSKDKPDKTAPRLKKEKAVIDKRVVIGLTYYDHDGTYIDKEQMHGKIIRVDKNYIAVDLEGVNAGTTYYLPRNLHAFRKASPGIYKLHSTGEEIVNPDYTTTWNVTKPPPD